MYRDYAELHERSMQNLYDFLNTEVDLGITFAGMAKRYLETGDSERYEAIDHFKD